jgi:hypothetical protein
METVEQPVRVRPGATVKIAAVFRDPADGSDLPVTITVFQLPAVCGAQPGIGLYFNDEAGQRLRGAVLRWGRGPDADPTLIHWERPHCEDDECGSPCGHRS